MVLGREVGLQVPLVEGISRHLPSKCQNSLFSDTLYIPAGISALFISIQLLHAALLFFQCLRNRSQANSDYASEDNDPRRHRTFLQAWKGEVKDRGGWMIFSFTVARFVGCMSLLILSCMSLLRDRDSSQRRFSPSDVSMCPETLMVFTYLYSSILAFVSLTMKKGAAVATRYNIALLLSTFGIYVYRDIWPLATYTLIPKDASEGPLLWIKFAILTVISVFIPLFVPQCYIPVDPKDPMPVPNPEQTSSWFSRFFYVYLDPVILHGSRVDHLEVGQLPPLADSDYPKHLIERAFPHLDPYRGAKNRHLFFGLLRVFYKDLSILTACIFTRVFFGFLSPIAIYNILRYLETGHSANNIRPWFWLFCLFISSTMGGTFLQRYLYVVTTMGAYIETVITQLVFEHSLRIRLASKDTEDSKVEEESDNNTVVGTPDTSSVAESSEVPEGGSSATGFAKESSEAQSANTVVSASSSKGKSKATLVATVSSPPARAKAGTKESNLVGRINNLVTTDLGYITDAKYFLNLVFRVPLEIGLCTVFLYRLLGWSAFVGLASMIVLLPLPGYAAKLSQDVQKERMRATDSRVQKVTEVVNSLRMIKLFGWEGKMLDQIQDARNSELTSLWKLKVIQTVTGTVNSAIPIGVMIITYATYTVSMKQELNASTIFSSLTVFNMLRAQLLEINVQITQLTQGKVSLDRVNDFLKKTPLLDSFTDPEVTQLPTRVNSTIEEHLIGFRNASFSWTDDNIDGCLTPSRRAFKLRVDGEVLFKPGCINLIVGPTGSGKTSMLMALLGEMHFIRSEPDAWFNIPRGEGLAYVPQESWVQSETIRDNILFGYPHDEERYRKVLRQCALDKDLELFEAGDKTEVGEKGITLSGGQKARVTLARAIYSPAKILLLDDILAALDVHTSTWIVDRCLRGDLVEGRTILLVTHNVPLLSPVAEYIVSIGKDGAIKTRSTDIEASIASDPLLALEVELAQQGLEIASEELDSSSSKKEASGNGKLVLAEEIEKGHVTWKSMKLFLTGLGGNYRLIFFSSWISLISLSNGFRAFQTWFLGYWGSQYEKQEPSEVRVKYYLFVYSLLVVGSIPVANASNVVYIFGSIRASKRVSTLLVESILGSTLRWLDETPTSRMIARCTQDIRAVDGQIAEAAESLTRVTALMISNIGVLIVFTPVFLFPGLAVAAVGAYLGNMYLKAQLSLKREMSNAKAPVLSHFSAAITGIISIRAYGAQSAFKKESVVRLDEYMRISRVCLSLNRWIGLRIALLGYLFSASLATYLVYGPSIGAANSGFSLNMAADFCLVISYWVTIFSNLEIQANSLERIQAYIDIDHEPKPTESGKPPAAWPTSGDLVVKDQTPNQSRGHRLDNCSDVLPKLEQSSAHRRLAQLVFALVWQELRHGRDASRCQNSRWKFPILYRIFAAMSSLKIQVPTIAVLREKVKDVFGVTPCLFQAQDAIAQLERKDCITIARTGSGKTLTFWMPLLFNDNGIIIVITALNILGDQNVMELARLNINAVNLTAQNTTDALFKEIEAGKYRAIVVSPEKILNDSRFDRLWENKKFTSRLFNISIDEGHCISQWGKEFRPEYAELGRLRWIVPQHVRFHVASATMPDHILNDVKASLHMRSDKTTIIRCSNDRPNIHIMVEEMKYSPTSARDLEKILRLKVCGINPPPKFMIFVNKRKEAEALVEKLWEGLPEDLRKKIIWFHSGMSSEFRESAIEQLLVGDVWGFLCTDAAGMGLDLPDIELVIQWRYVSSLCTLTQRLGRGARKPGTEATGIYLVESQYFDHAKKKATYSKKRKTTGAKQSRKNTQKRQRVALAPVTTRVNNSADDDNVSEGEPEEQSDNELEENRGAPSVQSQPAIGANISTSSGSPAIPGTLPTLATIPNEDEYEFLIMDAFINARSRGICRRVITNHYFGNHGSGNNNACCPRCGGTDTRSRLCCDTCSPDSFMLLSLTQLAEKPRVRRKINFKNFTMNSHDESFIVALDDWRTEQTKKEGLDGDEFFGSHFLLCDEILDRIVSLAQNFKIPDIEAFITQTGWCFAKKYGEDILKIVKEYYPDPPVNANPAALGQAATNAPANGPAPDSTITTAAPSQDHSKKKRTCKNCGSGSHISSNRECPNYRMRDDNAENIRPVSVDSTVTKRKCGACGTIGHTGTESPKF